MSKNHGAANITKFPIKTPTINLAPHARRLGLDAPTIMSNTPTTMQNNEAATIIIIISPVNRSNVSAGLSPSSARTVGIHISNNANIIMYFVFNMIL